MPFFITDIGHDLIIEVMDNGPGISEEVLNQIFTKGFSTKKVQTEDTDWQISKENGR